MTKPRLYPALSLVACAALAVALWTVTAVEGADDATVKPIAQVKDVMITVNGEGGVKQQVADAVKSGSLSDEDWEAVSARSAMIAEAGNLLLSLKPPRGADTPEGLAAWKKRVVEYRQCAEAIHDAAGKKDAAAAAAGLAGLQKRCSECHKEHKAKE